MTQQSVSQMFPAPEEAASETKRAALELMALMTGCRGNGAARCDAERSLATQPQGQFAWNHANTLLTAAAASQISSFFFLLCFFFGGGSDGDNKEEMINRNLAGEPRRAEDT